MTNDNFNFEKYNGFDCNECLRIVTLFAQQLINNKDFNFIFNNQDLEQAANCITEDNPEHREIYLKIAKNNIQILISFIPYILNEGYTDYQQKPIYYSREKQELPHTQSTILDSLSDRDIEAILKLDQYITKGATKEEDPYYNSPIRLHQPKQVALRLFNTKGSYFNHNYLQTLLNQYKLYEKEEKEQWGQSCPFFEHPVLIILKSIRYVPQELKINHLYDIQRRRPTHLGEKEIERWDKRGKIIKEKLVKHWLQITGH